MRGWLLSALLISVVLAHALTATTCAYSQAPASSTGVSQVNFVIANGPTSQMDGGIGIWRNGCIGEGTF